MLKNKFELVRLKTLAKKALKLNYFRIDNLQSISLQETVRDLSFELTLSQYSSHVRVFVFTPSPHVLLQDDHAPHDPNSGSPR